jgi:hypothetical protein
VQTWPPAYYINKLFEVINPEVFKYSRVLAPGPDAGLPSPHFDKRPAPQNHDEEKPSWLATPYSICCR